MYETYFGKTIADHIHGFKTRLNNHITQGGSGVSTCKFPIHINCSQVNNSQLEKLFFLYIYVMLSLKSNSCLKSLETLFQKRGHDILNNPSRNMIY